MHGAEHLELTPLTAELNVVVLEDCPQVRPLSHDTSTQLRYRSRLRLSFSANSGSPMS